MAHFRNEIKNKIEEFKKDITEQIKEDYTKIILNVDKIFQIISNNNIVPHK